MTVCIQWTDHVKKDSYAATALTKTEHAELVILDKYSHPYSIQNSIYICIKYLIPTLCYGYGFFQISAEFFILWSIIFLYFSTLELIGIIQKIPLSFESSMA